MRTTISTVTADKCCSVCIRDLAIASHGACKVLTCDCLVESQRALNQPGFAGCQFVLMDSVNADTESSNGRIRCFEHRDAGSIPASVAWKGMKASGWMRTLF